nr:hypothetical protein [Pseudomonas kuykendallii]
MSNTSNICRSRRNSAIRASGLILAGLEAQLGGDLRRQLLGRLQRRQVDEAHAVAEAPERLLGDAQRHRGLADPAGTDDGDQPARGDLALHILDQRVAAFDAGQAHRQFAAKGQQLHAAVVHLLDVGDEAVAALAHVGDVVARFRAGSQRAAQRGDVHAKVDFLDEGARPDAGDDRLLADDLAGAFHQHQENVQRTPADAQRAIAVEQQAPLRIEHEAAEAQALLLGGHIEIVHGQWALWPGQARLVSLL